MLGQVTPSIRKNSFSCPHCGAHAHQDWWDVLLQACQDSPFIIDPGQLEEFKSQSIAKGLPETEVAKLYSYVDKKAKGFIFLDKLSESKYCYHTLENVWVSQCYTCKQLAIWLHNRIIYPAYVSEVQPNQDLPEDIKTDFNEARSILTLSPRGSAALSRLAIEKLCKYLQAGGSRLDDMIADLVSKGLPTTLQKALDVVRVTGNEAVHSGSLDLRDDIGTAETLLKLINLIAENRITEPRRIDSLYNGLPPEKLSGIERRDKQSVL